VTIVCDHPIEYRSADICMACGAREDEFGWHRADPIPAAEALDRQGRMPNGEYKPTQPQIDYVRAIQRRLHLTNALLDNHCVSRFGRPFADLDKRRVKELLDEMTRWEQIPAEVRRQSGQADLPGIDH
jgi:hypothetical protein